MMDKKKPRTEYLYGTTKGEVTGFSVTVDPISGKISFGDNIGNTYSETRYERQKGPKVLSRVPQADGMLTFHTDEALKKNFDFICAVDTNTKVIQGKTVSATAIMIVTPIPQGEGRFWKFDLPFCLEFVELKEPRENFGWVVACQELWNASKVTNATRIAMIVDSDLGNINAYNQRKKPLYASFYLPKNVQLLYATSDAAKDEIPNKALAVADSVATQTLRAVEEGRAPFNQKKVESAWYEGYRIVVPNKITHTK